MDQNLGNSFGFGKIKCFSKIKHTLLEAILPNYCFLCGQPCPETLCNDCVKELPFNTQHCPNCALPLDQPGICGECLLTPPSFVQTISPFRYQDPLPLLIRQFKHRGHLQLGRLLSQHLCTPFYSLTDKPEALVAVPLHWRRQLQRGFNQAEVILHAINKTLQLPRLDLLQKKHSTALQHQLSRRERLTNLRNSFATKTPIDGMHIGLIDDVMTTSATADTLSRLLLKAGARQVSVLTLARTPKDR